MSYSAATSWLHWLSAPAMVGAVGSVLYAQTLTAESEKKRRGEIMFLHKSLGLTAGALLVPRLAAAALTRRAPPMPEAGALERAAAQAGHAGLYAFSAAMAGTGIYMGLAGGAGLPFFFTTLPAWAQGDKPGAKLAYGWHKWVGTWGKYLIPAHVGGALMHWARGHIIFARINPFTAAAVGGSVAAAAAEPPAAAEVSSGKSAVAAAELP